MPIPQNPIFASRSHFRESFARFLEDATARDDAGALRTMIEAVMPQQWHALPAMDLLPLLMHHDQYVRAATLRCAVPHVHPDASYHMFQMLTQEPDKFRERFLAFIEREDVCNDEVTLAELVRRLAMPEFQPLVGRLERGDLLPLFEVANGALIIPLMALLPHVTP